MKIYSQSMYGRGTIFLSPGRDHPETSDWIDPKTKQPRQFTVTFKAGMAEVDDQLGAYLVKQRLASRSPLIVPVPLAERELAEPTKYAQPIPVGRPLEAPRDEA